MVDVSPDVTVVVAPVRGRPSDFTDELARRICERMAAGETLKSVASDPEMPDASTIWRWRDGNRAFREAYERAREIAAEVFAGETVEISDDGTNDWMERRDKDDRSLGWQVNGEHVQRSALRVKTRQWYAAKLAPGRFGERSAVEVSGQMTLEHLILGANREGAEALAARIIEEHDRKRLEGPAEEEPK